jgi:WD40 repeat protein
LKITERGKADLVVVSPDGETLITSGRGRNLRLWDLRKGTDTELPDGSQSGLFSRDSRTLVATLRRPGMGGDRQHFGGWTNRTERAASIEIWHVPSHSLRTNIVLEAGLGVEAAALSPDGTLLAVSCSDDSIQLFEVATAKLIGTCTGHKQSIFSLAFSPDGKTLASASDDSTMKLWNVVTQQELLTERRLGGALRGLTFSPDGRWLVGGGSFTWQTGGLRSYRAASVQRDGCEVVGQPSRLSSRASRPQHSRGRDARQDKRDACPTNPVLPNHFLACIGSASG